MKLFKDINERKQQYEDGLISYEELLVCISGHTQEAADRQVARLKDKLEVLAGQSVKIEAVIDKDSEEESCESCDFSWYLQTGKMVCQMHKDRPVDGFCKHHQKDGFSKNC